MDNAIATHQPTAALELDLMPYINALINARWIIVLAMLAAALGTAVWAHSKPYMYESSARVSVVDIEDPGGVSPDDRRASQVLTLVEHGFVLGTKHDNYADVIRARLGSREFTMRFLEEYNVYRHFYPEQWQQDRAEWAPGFEPDRGKVLTLFRDNVRRIEGDDETGIVSVSMIWSDADLAKMWANAYVRSFNEFMRERTLEDVRRKQAFLERELRRSDVVEIQQSLFRLIEAQTAIAMLANAREEYVLEIIDPAALPYKSFNMSRKKKVLLGSVTGALLASFAVLAWVMLSRLLRSLRDYRAQHASAPATVEEH